MAATTPREGSTAPPDRRLRWSALDRRLRALLTVCALGGPVVLYGVVVAHFGVNTFYVDDWNSVDMVRRTYEHGLSWHVLWAQHNENRMLVPNLVVLGLAHATGLNVVVELWLSVVLLCVAVVFVVAAHRRRCRTVPLIVYAPVVVLAFSLAQVQNTLWGFQLAWYLVLACLAVAYFVLDRRVVSWWWWATAVAVGICGSVSSMQGLIVWPVGALLLAQRAQRWSRVGAWVGMGLATTVFYLHGLDQSAADPLPDFMVRHPGESLSFYVFLFGDVLGVPVKAFDAPVPGGWSVPALGAVLVVIGLLVVVTLGLRRDRDSGAPVGVALALSGLLFGVLTTQGRGIFGPWGASQGRYVTFDLLLPIGSYLALLGATVARRSTDRASGEPVAHGIRDGATTVVRRDRSAGRPRTWWRRNLPPRRWTGAVLGLMVALVAVQAVVGTAEGFAAARTHHALSQKGKAVTRSMGRYPDAVVTHYLYPGGSAAWLRQQDAFARRQRLGPFGGGPASSRR